MAILDNAIWLTGPGSTAVGGTTSVSEDGNTTTISTTFTPNAWDGTASGTGVSEFGAFGVSSPITATFDFSTPVEDLTFDLQHVNSGTGNDDQFTIYALDENGDLIDADVVIAGISGLVDELVYVNADGSVTVEAEGGTANDVTVSIPWMVSQLEVVYDNGPDAAVSGGAGIGDLSFTVLADTDQDGVADKIDIDDDNDGLLDVDEGLTTNTSTIRVTFDADQFTEVDDTRWEIRDADGNLIASDTTISNNVVEITDVPVDAGNFTFTIFDGFGDGLSGGDPASYQIEVDGVVVVDSGANPNFGDSVTEVFTVNPNETTTNSDGDAVANHLDLDSDNDGITDNVEGQSTDGYVPPTGNDADGDGLDDAYDATPTTGAPGSLGIAPVDTDNDGTFDVLDTDSDNDGISDVDEAGHGATQADIDASGDADGDGIADVVDDVTGRDVNDNDVDGGGDFTLADTDNDTAADGSGAEPLTADLDFRDAVPCFTPGTMLTGASGVVEAGNIRPGDLLMTVDHGLQPVRWVGTRTISTAELVGKPRFQTHNQNMTVAARAIAERKTLGHLS
ncbi:Hint domain-containing protein [Loktanella sp. Alg231-35]|uniref:Hint domain-containing protein n=1 Tax=Loktanella sp. Alg231-35 TaxID=1922220 RepID=UPI00131F2715|nr:Hint domain-containing protein [Loktanella sp. Alg231-35]